MFQSLQLFQSAWPVGPEEPGQASIREELSIGLAFGAIVAFVIRISNALHLFAARLARFSITAMYSHILAKRSDFLWKVDARFISQPIDPELERVSRGSEKLFPFHALSICG